jgi:hypothetical protein
MIKIKMMKRTAFWKKVSSAILLVVMSFSLTAATIYVNSSTGNDATGSGTSGAPYKTFHKGYTMASSGDIIDLTGTFTWTDADETGDVSTSYITNGYELAKSLTIRGQGTENTFIQAASTANTADRRVFYISGSSTVVSIEDLTMRHGKVSGAVYGNYYNRGGGVYISAATVNITGCNIEYNVLYGNNYGKTQGGGIYVSSSNPMTLEDCNIRYNEISAGSINNYGSAVVLDHGTTHIINNCTLNNNSAPGNIAALYGYYGSVKLTNSTICYNDDAGFENLFGSTTSYLTNCVFANNRGNGLNGGSSCSYYIKNCIFANNLGSYDFYPSSVTVYNNGYNIIETYSPGFSPAASDITGNQANLFGTGISATPTLGSNSSSNNAQTIALSSGSVAINAGASGTNGTVSVPLTDQRGFSRQSTTDIGAFEYVAYTWKGTTSTDFNTASNWDEASVPVAGADIIFDASPSRSCNLDADRTIGGLSNAQSTYDLVVNGHTLTISGSINHTNSAEIDASAASSVVKFSGGAAQTIPADAFTSDAVQNLTIDNASGVTLEGDLTVSSSLTINSGKVLNVGPGATLTVSGTTTNSAGNTGIVIKSDATGTGSIITTSSVGGTVENFQTYNKYHYYSSPIASSTYPFTSNFNNAYFWNEANQEWNRQFGSLTTGKGYATYPTTSDQTLSVAGTMNTGNQTIALACTDKNTSSDRDAEEGWELVGNPYPCGISISSLTSGNSSLIDGTVYLFEYYDGTSSGGGYNAQDYLATNGSGSVTNRVHSGGVTVSTIAPNQGFFVRVKHGQSGNLSFTNAMKSSSSHTFFTPDPDPIQRFYMGVRDEFGNYNRILLAFTNEATKGFDSQYDAEKLQGNPDLSLYSKLNDQKMVIQAFPAVEKADIIPLGLFAGKGGKYTFSVDSIENMPEYTNIYLLDNETHTTLPLEYGTTYTFETRSGDVDDRFYVVFKDENTSAIENESHVNDFVSYASGKDLFINIPERMTFGYQVYSTDGKCLISNRVDAESIFHAGQLPVNGVYIVVIQTEESKYVSKVIVAE